MKLSISRRTGVVRQNVPLGAMVSLEKICHGVVRQNMSLVAMVSLDEIYR